MTVGDSIEDRLRKAGRAIDPAIDWSATSGRTLEPALASAVGAPDDELSYLFLAVLFASIPTPDAIRAFSRRWALEGFQSTLSASVAAARRSRILDPNVRVTVVSGILVDVNDTGKSSFTTGIQRVARETVSRWAARHELTIVAWSTGYAHLRPPTQTELRRILLDPEVSGPSLQEASHHVVVPFRATFVLPEIAVDAARASRIRAIARYACKRSVAIGFDCIPVTTAETAGPGMPAAFSRYLTALARFDAIVAISSAAAAEFAGWQTMLSGTGITGPQVSAVPLPFDGKRPDDETIEEVARELGLAGDTVVLSVGSHEPRKNHLTLLHAAEKVWRTGADFSLVLVGGNSWDAESFTELVDKLRRRGRRIVLLSGVDDRIVWSLYALARVSVFPSLNEGFGLPVVESLANHTPVITSDFGSMRSLGENRGAILVDPTDAEALAQAIDLVIRDDEEHDRLVAQAKGVEITTWDEYADALWQTVEGSP